MAEFEIPLHQGPVRNVDSVALSDKSEILVNGYVDEENYINRRPGFTLGSAMGWVTTPSGIDVKGLYWWDKQQLLIAVRNGEVRQFTYPAFNETALSGITVSPNVPVTFAEDSAGNLFFAAKSRIGYTVPGVPSTSFIADADAPVMVSHIRFLDDYLIANEMGTNRFRWCQAGDYSDWRALNFAAATGSADNVDAIEIFNREVLLFGRKSLELWETDEDISFRPIAGAKYTVGCLAPYSHVDDGQYLYWISDKKRIVRFSGRGIEVLKTPFDKELQDISDVTDALGRQMEIGGQSFIVFIFPAGGKTFAWNLTTDTWAEWGRFVNGEYENFLGYSYCFIPDYGVHVWGSRSSSKLLLMSEDSDLEESDYVETLIRTGNIDHGTWKGKRNDRISIRMRRGDAEISEYPNGESPWVMCRWRDNKKSWSNEVKIPLGGIGETMIPVELPRLGSYKTRQWELRVNAPGKIIIGGMREEVTFLR